MCIRDRCYPAALRRNRFNTGVTRQNPEPDCIKQVIYLRGRSAEPVSEFTVAGTFAQMLKGIVMVGNDLEWRGSINCPTLRIDSMTVSGT